MAHASARSARQHKAWGAASEASKPQDPAIQNNFEPAERAKDAIHISRKTSIMIRLSPASRAWGIISIPILGLTPQPLRLRALRALDAYARFAHSLGVAHSY